MNHRRQTLIINTPRYLNELMKAVIDGGHEERLVVLLLQGAVDPVIERKWVGLLILPSVANDVAEQGYVLALDALKRVGLKFLCS